MLVRLSSRDFTDGKLNRTGVMAVMFYADWCPFSMAFKPTFEDFAKKEQVECGEANISHYEDPLWEQFQIRVVPTVLIFKEGIMTKRKDGTPFRGLSETDLKEIKKDLR